MKRKFKTGSCVRLISDMEDNIPMTTGQYYGDYEDAQFEPDYESKKDTDVLCSWRDKNGVPHKEWYHQDQLVNAK